MTIVGHPKIQQHTGPFDEVSISVSEALDDGQSACNLRMARDPGLTF
jgi:hypothetical protein